MRPEPEIFDGQQSAMQPLLEVLFGECCCWWCVCWPAWCWSTQPFRCWMSGSWIRVPRFPPRGAAFSTPVAPSQRSDTLLALLGTALLGGAGLACLIFFLELIDQRCDRLVSGQIAQVGRHAGQQRSFRLALHTRWQAVYPLSCRWRDNPRGAGAIHVNGIELVSFMRTPRIWICWRWAFAPGASLRTSPTCACYTHLP